MATARTHPVFVEASVQAGFPSPASDYVEKTLDLNAYLLSHPSATFFIRARGESMIGAGISDGDLLIVDRAFKSRHGDIVIACISGDFTVKRLRITGKVVALQPENPSYELIPLTDHADAEIWGVVTYVIKKTR